MCCTLEETWPNWIDGGAPNMKKKVSIKTFALFMSIIFTILTFAGAGYVLLNHGQVNAGYACVPMVLTIAFLALYRTKSNSKS